MGAVLLMQQPRGRAPHALGVGYITISSRSPRKMTRRAARFSSPCSSRTAGSISGASGAAASFFEGE